MDNGQIVEVGVLSA